jgi:hypothetical protein
VEEAPGGPAWRSEADEGGWRRGWWCVRVENHSIKVSFKWLLGFFCIYLRKHHLFRTNQRVPSSNHQCGCVDLNKKSVFVIATNQHSCIICFHTKCTWSIHYQHPTLLWLIIQLLMIKTIRDAPIDQPPIVIGRY